MSLRQIILGSPLPTMHNQTTLLIKAVLLFRQERGDAARVVINVPYHLHG